MRQLTLFVLSPLVLLSGCYSQSSYISLPEVKSHKVCEAELGFGMFWTGEYLNGNKLKRSHTTSPVYGCESIVISKSSDGAYESIMLLDKNSKPVGPALTNKWKSPDETLFDYSQCIVKRAREFNECGLGEDRFPNELILSFLEYSDSLDSAYLNEYNMSEIPEGAVLAFDVVERVTKQTSNEDIKHFVLSKYIKKLESRWSQIHQIFLSGLKQETNENIRFIQNEMLKLQAQEANERKQSIQNKNPTKTTTCMMIGHMLKCEEKSK